MTCTIGECTKEATRRIEIRRKAEDIHPAEIRPVCSSTLCAHIATLSAADFAVKIVN